MDKCQRVCYLEIPLSLDVYTLQRCFVLGEVMIRSDKYVLLPADLRDVEKLEKQLFDAGINTRCC